MKKLRHNKKRNTAFLYEALVREMTKSVMGKSDKSKEVILTIIKEHFKEGTQLRRELSCYKNLMEVKNLTPYSAEKLLHATKEMHAKVDKKDLFNEQTALINRVNKEVSKDVFTNFAPNYKSLATLYQIFNEKTPLNTKIILEERLVTRISSHPEDREAALMKPVDNLLYTTFVKKFNEEYSDSLLSEQKELLNKFIMSFLDNGVELKIHLNEEVGRLKSLLAESVATQEIQSDSKMVQKTKDVIELLESFAGEAITEPMIKKVLKVQNLVKEIEE